MLKSRCPTPPPPPRLSPPFRPRSFGKVKHNLIFIAMVVAQLLVIRGLETLLPSIDCAASSAWSKPTCLTTGTHPYPITILPIAYTLSLAVSEANFLANDSLADHSFHANSTMAFSALKTFSAVVVHSSGLHFSSIKLSTTAAFETPICGDADSCKEVASEIRCGLDM